MMTILEFTQNLPEGLTQHAKALRDKARHTGILKEPVTELGNDQWLAQELKINRQQVEEISNPKKNRL